MILPYFLKLWCLCLAAFFLIHTAAGLAISLAAAAAIRMAESMRPRIAARCLFFLRLLPTLLAAFVVLAVGVPSYVWLEPRAAEEAVNVVCCAAAMIGTAVAFVTILRMVKAALRSIQYARRCHQIGREVYLESAATRVRLLEVEAPIIALAGVLDSRVLISRSIVRVLSPDQLDAALGHEEAHRASRDNLKRFLFLLSPGIFAWTGGLAALERAWARFSEWAADDEATRGDERNSLSLAMALIRVARMGAPPQQPALVTPLIAGDDDLSTRVERLLRQSAEVPTSRWQRTAARSTALLFLAGAVAGATQFPAILRAAHILFERLVG